MATYKVIQDIEAEDKLIGPLTLRQSIYAGIAVVLGYLSFVFLTNKLSLLLIFTFPPMLFTGFFAFPWGRDQSTEIWALAKIRFYIKSRKRIWDQAGVKNLVTITAPKKIAKQYTNGLSAGEVQSRLNALASTLDTRGWAVKNVYTIPPLMAQQSSDRLVEASEMPQQVVAEDITEADDILGETNPNAHRLQEMVAAASNSHKQELLAHMQQGDMPAPAMTGAQEQPGNWFTANPVSLPQPVGMVPEPIDTNDAAISEELHKRHENTSTEHLKTIEPLSARKAKPVPAPKLKPVPLPTPAPIMTPPPNPVTMHLAQRDDLTISTISRMAKGDDEVVISLH